MVDTARASQLSSRRRERSLGRLQLPTASSVETPVDTHAEQLAELRVEYAKLQSKLEAETTRHAAEIEVLHAKNAQHEADAAKYRADAAKYEAEIALLRDENAALQASLAAARESASAAKEAARGEAPPAELAAEKDAQADIADERATGACTFFFVPVSRLLAGQARGERTLPKHQQLYDEGALVERRLTRSECYRAKHTGKVLAISHRWERPEEPDTQGIQYQAILKHVAGTSIELVWFE